MPLKVMTIFGTRPEAVKMAPLVKELESRAEIQSICCITAQHRQMLDDVLQLFAIQPDYDLDIMEARQSLYTITSKCLLGMEESFPGKSRTWFWSMGTRPPPFPGRWQPFIRKLRWATWRRACGPGTNTPLSPRR